MALDRTLLEDTLCKRLCAKIRVHECDDGVLMLDTPFTFPDGDHCPIYVTQAGSAKVTLSDRGHTLMQMSYEHDVDPFYEGTRRVLLEQIVRDSDIQVDNGPFSAEAPPDQIADAVSRLGQALKKTTPSRS